MRKTLLSILTAVALTFMGWTVIAASAATNPTTLAANFQTLTFDIEKMTCAACPITVKKAMQKVEGVKHVDVDYETKTATVNFDPAVTSADEIAAASTNAGYPASLAGEAGGKS